MTILHTADLHGAAAKVVDTVRELRRRLPEALWFDSGDALGGPNITLGLLREETLGAMSRARCTAMALGNREFEPFAPCLRRKLRPARFPVVCTNLEHPRPEAAPVCRSVFVRTAAGARLRVLGALRDMLPSRFERAISGFRFADPETALRDELRETDDEEFVVLLSHLGAEPDLALFEALPRIDLILGGHDHVERACVAGERAMLAPRPHGEGVVVLRAGDGPVRVATWPDETIDACVARMEG